jgi:hypothetical protein
MVCDKSLYHSLTWKKTNEKRTLVITPDNANNPVDCRWPPFSPREHSNERMEKGSCREHRRFARNRPFPLHRSASNPALDLGGSIGTLSHGAQLLLYSPHIQRGAGKRNANSTSSIVIYLSFIALLLELVFRYWHH